MIEIYIDEDGFYYNEKIENGYEGNYYDRELWSQDALAALIHYANSAKFQDDLKKLRSQFEGVCDICEKPIIRINGYWFHLGFDLSHTPKLEE